MHKIFATVGILLFGLNTVASAAELNCELRSIRRNMDAKSGDFVNEPAQFPDCKLNGNELSLNPKTGFAYFSVPAVESVLPIVCGASLNALIKIKAPLVTIAITDKDGKILDVRTELVNRLSKESYMVSQLPMQATYVDFLSLSCGN
jgi:hypothetical protein